MSGSPPPIRNSPLLAFKLVAFKLMALEWGPSGRKIRTIAQSVLLALVLASGFASYPTFASTKSSSPGKDACPLAYALAIYSPTLSKLPILYSSNLADVKKLRPQDGFLGDNNQGLYRAELHHRPVFIKWLDATKPETFREIFITAYLGQVSVGPAFYGVVAKRKLIAVVTEFLPAQSYYLGLDQPDVSLPRRVYRDAVKRYRILKRLGLKPSDTQARYDASEVLRIIDPGYFEWNDEALKERADASIAELKERLMDGRNKRFFFWR